MKKILLFVSALAIITLSCTKEGPQGPAGARGTAGNDGKDGLNGVTGPTGPTGANASVNCTQCHNNDMKLPAAQVQYEQSVHGAGERAFETGTSCAACHTNEGFNECIAAGTDNTAAAIVTPTQISCYTCHKIHKNYDITDLDLKTTAPVTLRTDPTITIDLGKGNLCAKCHQPRSISVVGPTGTAVNLYTAANTDSIYIKSNRFGPHHGPQSTLLAGKDKSGAFQIVGTATYENGPHTTITNGCITCHMASPFGIIAGGHTMKVIYENEGSESINITGCVACHSGKTAAQMLTKVQATQTEVQTLMDELEAALVAKGWYDSTLDLWKIPTTGAKAIKVNVKEAKAMYNFKFIWEDRSLGVHNPTFAKALLQNSLEAVQ